MNTATSAWLVRIRTSQRSFLVTSMTATAAAITMVAIRIAICCFMVASPCLSARKRLPLCCLGIKMGLKLILSHLGLFSFCHQLMLKAESLKHPPQYYWQSDMVATELTGIESRWKENCDGANLASYWNRFSSSFASIRFLSMNSARSLT